MKKTRLRTASASRKTDKAKRHKYRKFDELLPKLCTAKYNETRSAEICKQKVAKEEDKKGSSKTPRKHIKQIKSRKKAKRSVCSTATISSGSVERISSDSRAQSKERLKTSKEQTKETPIDSRETTSGRPVQSKEYVSKSFDSREYLIKSSKEPIYSSECTEEYYAKQLSKLSSTEESTESWQQKNYTEENLKKKEKGVDDTWDKKKTSGRKKPKRPHYYKSPRNRAPEGRKLKKKKSIQRYPRPYYYDPDRDVVPDSLRDLKKISWRRKRTPRPYYYDSVRDVVPESLKENKSRKIKRTPRPRYYDPNKDDVPASLKDRKPQKLVEEGGQRKEEANLRAADKVHPKRMRPFCYDESLDGVAESLMSINDTESSESEVMTCPVSETPSCGSDESFEQSAIKTESSIESETDEDDTKEDETQIQDYPVSINIPKISHTDDASIRRGSSSVQKLVKGEKITDFAHSYFFFKSNLIKTLKLQHEFLWKMEFHISEFCRSEVLKQGKNRTSTVVNFNEGAVRLVPTMSEDSCYIHASRINLPYGNFIIAQGPTQTSLIDFFRMLWQYRIPLVVCLDSLTNQDTCYRYFSTKRQQAVKASDRITIETTGIMETTVPNLFIYEAVITNTEIKSGSNHRIIHIVHYDKWEGENTISPQVLVKIITIMKTMSDKFDQKSIVVHGSNGIKRSVVYVLTSVLMQQITKFRRLSVLSAPIAVCKRRYGALRSVDDYRLVLQSALCFAKQCELITDMKKYENAMEESYHPRLDSRSYIRICTTDIGGKECEQTMTNCVI